MFKMNKNKRKRACNWVEEDKTLLKELVKEKFEAIENKNTDTNSNQKKKEAWLEIEESFNNFCQGVTRNVVQLKSQWTFTKIQAKKMRSMHRKQINRNGIGTKPPEVELAGDDMLSIWSNNEFIENNEFNADAIKCEPNMLQIIKHASPKKIENDFEEDLEETLIPDIEENYLEREESRERYNIQKKMKLPDLNQNKLKTIADVQLKNLEELHLIQMENERKRARNLDLEYEILQDKKKFFKNKLNDNG